MTSLVLFITTQLGANQIPFPGGTGDIESVNLWDSGVEIIGEQNFVDRLRKEGIEPADEVLIPIGGQINGHLNQGLAKVLNAMTNDVEQTPMMSAEEDGFVQYFGGFLNEFEGALQPLVVSDLSQGGVFAKTKLLVKKTNGTSVIIDIKPVFFTRGVANMLFNQEQIPFVCINDAFFRNAHNRAPVIPSKGEGKVRSKLLINRAAFFLSAIYNGEQVINQYQVRNKENAPPPHNPGIGSGFRTSDAERAMLVYLFSNWSQMALLGDIDLSEDSLEEDTLGERDGPDVVGGFPALVDEVGRLIDGESAPIENDEIQKITLLIQAANVPCGACSRMLEKLSAHYGNKLEIIFKGNRGYPHANYRGDFGDPRAPDQIRTSVTGTPFYFQFWNGQATIWETAESGHVEQIFSTL